MDDKLILVSKRDAARQLSVSPRTLDNLIAGRELPVRRIGRRVLIPRKALENFARRDHPTRNRERGMDE
jgi:excisionase family DNA binding protein